MLSKNQTPKIIWLTGLLQAGKSIITNELDKTLFDNNMHSYILDRNNIRSSLSNNLAFTDADRIENIRRIAEVSKLFL
ncbi:adenylyl-sulfate kinase [Marinomonas sp. 2405UD68-3]|uniref:adenylyl-sulfate kinase n=1 Tax=Marinomonas sp. 2405UD68-3 TaxID=3391835 RepID=UPI0039C8F29D